MLIRASFACVVLAISQGVANPSHAAEAFLCDQNTVIYVETNQLDELKHTNACIASYFGIKLDDGPPAASKAAATSGAPASLDLKTLTETGSADRFVPGQHVLRRVASLDGPRAPRAAPLASPGTDFRNIKVINPVEGDGWFHHAR
jgi:hypothetical protein